MNLANRLRRWPWADQAVVLLHAATTGVLVVAFTWLAEYASEAHKAARTMSSWAAYAALAWTPLCTVAILWWTRRHAPGAAGSGIPQVMLALDRDLEGPALKAFVSLRLSLQKIALVSAGLFAGLSIGREGPTVQVGAGVMLHARRWLSAKSPIDGHDLMVAGAAAGIAAAFNTPLGGIVFAIEQLTRRRGMAHSSLVIAAIVLSGLVAVSVLGNDTYFGRLQVQGLSWSLVGPGLAVSLASGLAGGIFSRLIVESMNAGPQPVLRWRAAHPYRFAAIGGLLVALMGLVTGGLTSGAGYLPTRAMLEGSSDVPGTYTLLKFCATWISAWTGVPAGVFAPSLSIGAGIGHDVAVVIGVPSEARIALIALGMVGFLAATTQGPITSFIIVMEMVAGQSMVLSLMASALVASGVSRLLTRGAMYAELADRLAATAPPSASGEEPARRH